MKAADRIRRNSAMYTAHTRGFTVKTLARQYDLCEDQVRRIIKTEASRQPSPFELPAIDYIQDVVVGLRADIEELAPIAIITPKDSDKVKARRAMMQTRNSLVKLYERMGLLPPKPGHISALSYQELDLSLRKVLRRHAADLELQQELSTALEAWA
jgi:hypothetical protein